MTTETKNDGGSAFPVQVLPGSQFGPSEGMSLGDWYAGMAMQGMLANPNYTEEILKAIDDDTKEFGRLLDAKQMIALNADSQSDAMLAERAKGKDDA